MDEFPGNPHNPPLAKGGEGDFSRLPGIFPSYKPGCIFEALSVKIENKKINIILTT
jgi:hypothetical protein